MTREETINILKELLDLVESPVLLTIDRGYALKMAIKALEQEPILDKIRAEIETWHKEGTNWSDIRLMHIEDILDKYKAESEPQESENKE